MKFGISKNDPDLVEKSIDNPTSAITSVQLPKFLLEADHIINMPIFKSHVSMVFTCALKNLKGVVQDMHPFCHAHHQPGRSHDGPGGCFSAGSDHCRSDPSHGGIRSSFGNPGGHGCGPGQCGTWWLWMPRPAGWWGWISTRWIISRRPSRRGWGDLTKTILNCAASLWRMPGWIFICRTFRDSKPGQSITFIWAWPAAPARDWPRSPWERLKALGEYEKNQGLHIVLGRKPPIPERFESDDVCLLFGDCTGPFRKRIEKAGGKCLQVSGCPPVEPFPYWTIMDREEQPTEKASRERHTEEDRVFKQWLSNQKR